MLESLRFIVFAWQNNRFRFMTTRMKTGACPSSLVHPWNRAKKRCTKARQYFVTQAGFIPSNALQEYMCGHRALDLLVPRSPQLPFMLGSRSSCGHKSVLAICVFLALVAYKRRVGNIILVKNQPCQRNECVKKTVPVKLFKVQTSEKMWRPVPPQPPHFRRP